jgi:hypothetical protein
MASFFQAASPQLNEIGTPVGLNKTEQESGDGNILVLPTPVVDRPIKGYPRRHQKDQFRKLIRLMRTFEKGKNVGYPITIRPIDSTT